MKPYILVFIKNLRFYTDDDDSKGVIKTTQQVFRLAASKILMLDIREIEVRISYDFDKEILVIYESNEGGSGMLGLLRNNLNQFLKTAYEIANEECTNPFCSISCPECLLSYDRQNEENEIQRENCKRNF